MSLLNIDKLLTYMGNPKLTPAQKDLTVQDIIPGIQGELEDYLNTYVELVQVRESLAPEADGYVYFTKAPVRQLLSFQWSAAGALPITITSWAPTPVVPNPYVERPVVDRTAVGTTPSPYRQYVGLASVPGLHSGITPYVVVDYIAGIDGPNTIPSLITSLLRVTAREVDKQFDTTAGLRTGSVEAAAESDNRPKGWTDAELKRFQRYKRRVIL
jgi:hypothetical protein